MHATKHLKSAVTKTDVDSHFAMWKKVTLPLQGIFLNLILLLVLTSITDCMPPRAVLLDAEPVGAVSVHRAYYPPTIRKNFPKRFYRPEPEEYYEEPDFLEEDSFSIGPEDAVKDQRFSPPLHDINVHRPIRQDYAYEDRQPESSNHKEVYVPTVPNPQHSVHLDNEKLFIETTVTSDYKVSDGIYQGASLKDHLSHNNFTIKNETHDIVSSDTILRYHPPPIGIDKSIQSEDVNKKRIESTVYDIQNFTRTENVFVLSTTSNSMHDIDVLLKDSTDVNDESSQEVLEKQYTTVSTVYFSVDSKVTFPPIVNDSVDNSTNTLPPVGSTKPYKFSSGAVAGIVIAVLTCVTVVTSSVIYLLYRRYSGQCTSVVESKFNSDNCGYLDDSMRSSVYLNNHIELPKENSEEMTSLDNDSFLNSLETMTIQNYWADNTKNTKV